MTLFFTCHKQKGDYTCEDCPDDWDCGQEALALLSIDGKEYTEAQLREIIEQAWQYRELCK